MAILKNEKHKEYTRFAAHCLEMVTVTRDQEFSVHSTRNGCRMAAAGGCCSSSIEIRDVIYSGLLCVHFQPMNERASWVPQSAGRTLR